MVLDEARGARTAGAATVVAAPRWYVVWTRSHSEPLVEDQLAARGFRVFNPQIDVWSRRRQQRHRIQVPMFPGYLFVHHVLDKESDIEIRKARGVVAILGETWERRAVVPDPEIDAICTLTRSGLAAIPHPYLREGRRVRIVRGPMTDVEGILVRNDHHKGLLVLSVELLRRSVAVEIDCTMVRPA